MSKIEWTGETWNPVRGCTRISPGCVNCYAERMAARGLPGLNSPTTGHPFAILTPSGPRWTGELELIKDRLSIPYGWKKPRMVFVNSMSDLFHEKLPAKDIEQVWEVMAGTSRHTYQVLTKRGNRMRELTPYLVSKYALLQNVWCGVSVENADYLHRINELRSARAAVRFLSLEPLLGPLPNLNLDGIDWVIVGGESGPGARPMAADWVRDIRDQCIAAGCPFFFKQWGGVKKKATGRVLDGRAWDEMPGGIALVKNTGLVEIGGKA